MVYTGAKPHIDPEEYIKEVYAPGALCVAGRSADVLAPTTTLLLRISKLTKYAYAKATKFGLMQTFAGGKAAAVVGWVKRKSRRAAGQAERSC